jgi:alkanesulfonate monooxygenase SsuD/methylene tetrahydromethanopterin reductase-like flavin-dependent oxidoreductase (luciferase family)
MPDYGHDLHFGTFITPLNAPPQGAVELAMLSERLGYDLVALQDHPYQPRFHDTWTLLSYVAARTDRIRLSGDVLSLPLRQPAVLARAAASIDLLSGGRFDLALGAGGFWDAIEAMGGQRLQPREAVQAMEEAIAIIRGIWDPEDRTPLRVPGEFHHVDGAKRGPAPAHDIPITVGAYGPRMLRLIGRSADGWLPSLGRLEPGDLARGNTVIDAAATDAGRDPGGIRRWLNIGELPAERLAELVVADGVGTFILASDEPAVLERFAAEVIPAVRAAVASERSR